MNVDEKFNDFLKDVCIKVSKKFLKAVFGR